MKTTGERIRYIRSNILDKTGNEFGKLLNVTKVAVSNWENNNRMPDADMLVKIADLGDVSVDWLLCRTDNPSSKILKTNYKGDEFEVEIDKNYPHDLSPEDVESLLEQLRKTGFDVDTLIKNTRIK